MRILKAACGLVVVGTVASAQAAPEHRVRVLGDTMARQVLTRVNPVYPAAALERGIGGEVVLYTVVGKDGGVEQVAVVYGPAALQSAAMDAVKQWKFAPWLVNGTPVEVDTTVAVDFKPGESAPAAVAPNSLVTPVKPMAVAAPSSTPVVAARASNVRSGTIDWETDRRAFASPAKPAGASLEPAASVVANTSSTASFARPQVAVVPAVAVASPVRKSAEPSSPVSSGGSFTVAEGSPSQSVPPARSRTRDAGLPPPSTFEGAAPSAAPRTMATGVVLANGGGTEWHLIKKVAPEYPQPAVDAGIEGVVLVAGVVKTDGRLRDLHAVSGPEELRQAAVDAAAQYVYEPVMHGDDLAEAKTQVPVTFTLSGPAKVAPEVMAGRILNSFTPPYPPEAIKEGISGAVILHVLIGRQGQVKDVQVVSGREVLRATAVDAVKQWRYLPYKRNGVDVEVETDVEVQFTLLRQ